jgi:metallophosphoesterase superfamily enzyme
MDTSRILVIGDLHTPFEHRDYLQHCKDVRKFYKTTHTIFIGDIIDAHYSSFHETNPDGWGAGDELEKATEKLYQWHKAFIGADVILGNHDRMAMRKIMSSGLSQRWLRGIDEVLNTPSWKYHMRRVYDGVLYIHGEGVTARTKAQRAGRSVVQGHRHSESYVWYNPKDSGTQFGVQVGCGVDADTYAFAYAKDHPAPVMSCAVVLDKGSHAHIIPMT